MYAAVRRYTFEPKNSERIDTQIHEGFLPLMKKIPGFVAYYWVDSGSGTGASISVFDAKSGAEESVKVAAEFVKKNLAQVLGKPEITQGEVKAFTTRK